MADTTTSEGKEATASAEISHPQEPSTLAASSELEAGEKEKGPRFDRDKEEDHIYSQILAKDTADVPAGYFLSANYIMTMISMSLTVVSTYFGFAVPGSVVSFINADIGNAPQHR